MMKKSYFLLYLILISELLIGQKSFGQCPRLDGSVGTDDPFIPGIEVCYQSGGTAADITFTFENDGSDFESFLLYDVVANSYLLEEISPVVYVHTPGSNIWVVQNVPDQFAGDNARYVFIKTNDVVNCGTYGGLGIDLNPDDELMIEDANITIVDNNRCVAPFNGAINISVTGGYGIYTYEWDGPNGFTSTDQNILSLEAGRYSISITDEHKCTYTRNIDVADNSEIQDISFSGLDAAYCENEPAVELTGSVAPNGSFSGPGITDNGNGTANFNPASAGVGGDVTYTYTDALGCTGTSTETAVVSPIPATPTANNNGPACEGGDVQLSTPEVVGATYKWTGASGFTSSDQSPLISAITLAGAGLYAVTIDDGTCTSLPGETTVVVEAAPNATITPAGPFCETDGSTNLTAATAGGTWSGTGITDGSAGTFDPVAAGDGTHSITYTVTVGACTSVNTENITVIPLPEPTITGPLNVCAGSTEIYTTESGNTNYQWAVSGGTITAGGGTNDDNVTVLWDGAGPTYTIDINYENALGCSGATATQSTITVHLLPVDALNPVDNAYCAGDALPSISVDDPGAGFRIDWYDAGTAGNLVGTGASFTPTVAGTYWAEVVSVPGNCVSANRVSATLAETPLPVDALNPVDNAYCAGDALPSISVDDPGAGFRIDWYDASTAGTLVATGAAFTPTAAGTYWAEVINEATLCVSANRTSATLTENPLPLDATNPVDNTYCVGSPLPSISVDDPGAGFRIDWYDASTAGNLVATGAAFTPTAAGTYWAEVINEATLCVSANRTSATLTENPLPLDATNPVDNTYCIGNPLTPISVDDPGAGFRIDWYDAGTAGNLVGTGASFTPTVAGTYWAEVVSVPGNCVSANRVSATLAETPLPVDALNPVDNAYCAGDALPSISVDDPGAGFRIDWYDASTAGNLVATGAAFTPTGAGTYWAEVINETTLCVSANRTSATLTENPLPLDATNPVDNTYCIGNPLTSISVDDPGAGFRIDWYDASTAGTLVATGAAFTPTAAGTYWAEVINEATLCVSANRTSATLTENPIPADASNPVDNTYCVGSPLTSISVDDPGTGFRVDWYDANTAGNLVGTGPAFTPAAAGTYWAEVVSDPGSCVSANRVSATLTATPLPNDAINPVNNAYCAGGDLTPISVDDPGAGFRIDWYDASTAGTLVATGAAFTPTAAGTYWAEVINETTLCVSANRTSATLSENQLPLDATNPVDNTYCVGSPLTPISVDDPEAGSRIDWYDASTAGNLVATGAAFTPTAAGTYWAEVINEATLCVSANRTSATLTENPIPADASNPVDNTYCVGSPLTPISVDDPGAGFRIDWYDASTAGNLVAIGAAFTPTAAGTYWAEVINETTLCVSANRTSATLSENQLPLDATNPVDNTYCVGSPLTPISVDDPEAGSRIDWYDASTAGNLVATGAAFTPTAAGTYWAEVINEATLCVSANRTSATLTENPLPLDATNPVDNTYCVGSPLTPISVDDPGAGFRIDWYDAGTAGNLVGIGASFTPTVAGTYWAEVVSVPGNCVSANRVSATLAETPLPVDALNPVDNAYCAGDALPSISVDDPGAGFRIDWYDASTAGNLVATGAAFTPTAAGTYWAEVVSIPGSCVSANRVSATLAETPLPVEALNPVDNAYCAGDALTPISVDDPGAGFRIDWYDASTAGNLVATGAAFTPTAAGTYWAEVINETTFCVSTNRTPAALTENPIPTPTISGEFTVCAGSTEAYATESGNSNYSWVVVGGTVTVGGSINDDNITVRWDGTGPTYSIDVNYETDGGCSAADPTQEFVSVISVVPPIATNDGPSCQGGDVQLSTPEVAGAIYTWTGPNGFSSNLQEPIIENVTAMVAGTYSVTITLGPCTSLEGSTEVAVNPNPLPTATLSGGTTVCPGTEANLTVELTGVAPWTLVYSDGTNTYTEIIADSPFSWPVAPLITTTYTPVSVSDANCNGTVDGNAIVEVTPAKEVTIILDNVSEAPGEEVEVPVRVVDFENLMSMQFTIAWDASLLSFSGISAINLGNASETNFEIANVSDGVLTFNWTTASLSDTTIADNTAIFAVAFDIPETVLCSDAAVGIDQTPEAPKPLLFTDENLCVANVTVVEGNVEIDATVSISSSDDDNLICFGDQVIFTASGGLANYDFYLNGGVVQSGAKNVYINSSLDDKDSVNVIVTDAQSCALTAQGIVTNVNQLSITPTITPISACGGSDGEIVLTVEGGSDNYSYLWSGPGIAPGNETSKDQVGLVRGFYQVDVTDDVSLCVESLDIELKEPVDFTLSALKTDVTSTGGNDGSIDLTITGGVGPFEINWTGPNGFESTEEDLVDLFAGSYQATVTDQDNGCTDAIIVEISQPISGLVLSATKTDVSTCGAMDGTINLLIAGGSGDYDVSWVGPNGFTSNDQNLAGLESGLYIATVVDVVTSLSAQWSVQVEAPEGYSIDATVTDITYCSGADGSVSLIVTGGSGDFGYVWTDLSGLGFGSTDKDILDLQLGTYRVVVTDHVSGCIDSLDAVVGRPAICDQPCGLYVESTTNNTSCPDTEDGAAVINIISGGSGFGNYWVSLDTGKTFVPFLGQDITAIIDQGQGSYLYIVKDTVTGCTDQTVANVGVSTNLMANISVSDAGCSEDDGTITFNVSGGLVPFEVEIIDEEDIVTTQQGNGFFQFDNLSPGSYLYIVREQSGCTIVATDAIVVEVDCGSGCGSLVASARDFEDATCATDPNGKAIIDVLGGSSPYEYSVDAVNWIPFISGNAIENLPPNGTYNIAIRQDAENADCRTTVSVTINGPGPIVLETPIITTQKATCNQFDGAVKIGRVAGGTGSYTYQIDEQFITLPADSIIGELKAGIHTFSVIDEVACQENFTFEVESPGVVVAKIADIPVSCDAIDQKAGLSIEIDFELTTLPGPYTGTLAKASDPDNSTTYEIPDNGILTMTGLDKDFYSIEISSGTEGGCNYTESIAIFGGAYPVDFEVLASDTIVTCVGDFGSITIGNVVGDPDTTFIVQLLSQSSEILETFELYLLDFEGGFTIDESNTDKLLTGKYFVRIIQNQEECARVAAVSDLIIIAEPTGTLGFEVLEDQVSVSDRPTGYISGEVLTSGGNPYEARIQLLDPLLDMNISDIRAFNANRQWEEVPRSNDDLNRYPHTFDTLWAGTYEIGVRDVYGCEFYMEYSVGYDENVFIPNIFTPNDDGYNDTFYIRNLPESGTKVIISDRNGYVVFRSDDYNINTLWDGGNVSDGIYYYSINMPSGETFKGWIEKWSGVRP
jgi:gliding motility-associated-like protein